MLVLEAQHSCPGWPSSAALCPGSCPEQKLDIQPLPGGTDVSVGC